MMNHSPPVIEEPFRDPSMTSDIGILGHRCYDRILFDYRFTRTVCADRLIVIDAGLTVITGVIYRYSKAEHSASCSNEAHRGQFLGA